MTTSSWWAAVAAALTGLVFVAMTLHLDDIVSDPVHRHRARTILTGLTAVFIRCALALMGGQKRPGNRGRADLRPSRRRGRSYRSIRQAMSSADQGVLLRTLGSFACLVLEQIGALILFAGSVGGLYVVGIGMMSSFIFMVTGAWLLIVGVGKARFGRARAAR